MKRLSQLVLVIGVISLKGASGLSFFDPPILDPNDPLENTGTYEVEKLPTDIFLDTDSLTAEFFIPMTAEEDDQLRGFVLFMPGFGSSFKAYEDYLTHLASHGFLTVGMDFPPAGFTFESEHDIKAQQALDAIAYVQGMDPRYASLPVVTAGHSMGGKIAFYAASLDTSNTISGVMAMDPVNSGGGPCFISPQCTAYPVAPNVQSEQRGVMYQMSDSTSSLIFRSEPDLFTNPDEQFNALYFFYGSNEQGQDASPSPTWYYDMGDFPHTAYVPMLCSEEVQIMKRTMVAFLEQQIEGIDRNDYLTGDIIQNDIDSGYLVEVEYR